MLCIPTADDFVLVVVEDFACHQVWESSYNEIPKEG